MSRPKEVNKLLNKLTDNVGKGPLQPLQPEGRFEHYLMPENDVSPYKTAGAWPGKSFVLLGNSFNLEAKVETAKTQTKRTASLAMMFEQARENRRCMYVGEALTNESFLEVLSRFEHDWLRRMPGDTVIGPAYDMNGTLIAEAFAVWKSAASPVKHKEVKVLAKTR
jgi:hypothetical protein